MAAHFPPYTKPTQEPTGAYRAPSEIDEVEALLKTAHAHMRHVAECIDKALAAHIHSRSKRLIARMTAEAQARGEYDQLVQPDASTQHGQSRKLYDAQTLRDVAWSAKRDDLPPNLAAAIKTPLEPTRIATPAELADLRQLLTAEELKGFGIGDVEPRHPMAAEALRQADEFERGDKETGV